MIEFFNMGGYASFIWPSWGIAVCIMIGITIQSLIKSRQINRRLKQLDQKQDHKNG